MTVSLSPFQVPRRSGVEVCAMAEFVTVRAASDTMIQASFDIAYSFVRSMNCANHSSTDADTAKAGLTSLSLFDAVPFRLFPYVALRLLYTPATKERKTDTANNR